MTGHPSFKTASFVFDAGQKTIHIEIQ
ncbi:MAG: hypothetical protein ACLFP1_07190 [Candidatus Goldiibacteriota bacterium]